MDSAIKRYANVIIAEANQKGADRILFALGDIKFTIDLDVAGELVALPPSPKHLWLPIRNVFFAMAEVNPWEKTVNEAALSDLNGNDWSLSADAKQELWSLTRMQKVEPEGRAESRKLDPTP